MADQTLRFALDFANIEEADDGNTTYFGGTYLLDGAEKRGHGDDRSSNFRHDVEDHILEACQAKWAELKEMGAFDVSVDLVDELNGEVDDLVNGNASGTIVVTKQDNGIFVVTRE